METVISKHLKFVRPISLHPCFQRSWQCSDKVILPSSLAKQISRFNIGSFLIRIQSQRFKLRKIVCGIIDFSAQQNFLYCPWRVLQLLGQKSVLSSKCGVYVFTLSEKQAECYPQIRTIKLYMNRKVSEAQIRRGLQNYSMLQSGQKILIYYEGKVLQAIVLQILPGIRGILKSQKFEIRLVYRKPKIQGVQNVRSYGSPRRLCKSGTRQRKSIDMARYWIRTPQKVCLTPLRRKRLLSQISSREQINLESQQEETYEQQRVLPWENSDFSMENGVTLSKFQLLKNDTPVLQAKYLI